MARVYTTNHHVKEFLRILDSIKPSKNRHEVFYDWLIMAAASLYVWKKDQKVENEYLEIAKNYTKDELDKHSELLLITVNALEKTEQDFLGELFTAAELTNSRTGQFFTPYHISQMMAKMAICEKELSNKKIFKINEPCCGAGGMMIAAISVLKEKNFNYQQDAYFLGVDIDARCARMAYIQLSLLGAPAVIICGNTITLETYWQRETIGYHLSGMGFRLRAEMMLETMKEIGKTTAMQAEEKTPVKISLSPSRELVQGELF
jgi:type I restriction-modification system DNA methylase subunit